MLIRHVVAPLDLTFFRLSHGRWVFGRRANGIVLLTTRGSRTGRWHATPVFAWPRGAGLIVCNTRPRGERRNPWPHNLDVHPHAQVYAGDGTSSFHARRATPQETERVWPELVARWPSYGVQFERSGERSVFALEPGDAVSYTASVNPTAARCDHGDRVR
jgi:deazaflavin-dependent oxidoreductase (nitroreductase family)